MCVLEEEDDEWVDVVCSEVDVGVAEVDETMVDETMVDETEVVGSAAAAATTLVVVG